MSALTAPQDAVEQNIADGEQQKMWDYYEQEVLKGLESGTWIQGTPEFWEKLRKEARERRESRKTSAVLRNP